MTVLGSVTCEFIFIANLFYLHSYESLYFFKNQLPIQSKIKTYQNTYICPFFEVFLEAMVWTTAKPNYHCFHRQLNPMILATKGQSFSFRTHAPISSEKMFRKKGYHLIPNGNLWVNSKDQVVCFTQGLEKCPLCCDLGPQCLFL